MSETGVGLYMGRVKVVIALIAVILFLSTYVITKF